MSDDSFIREVNDEIRREQAQKLWDRFGPALIVIAVLVVLVFMMLSGGLRWCWPLRCSASQWNGLFCFAASG